MRISRQEHWSGLQFPSPRHLHTYFDLFLKLLQLWKDCGKMGGMLGGSEKKSELYVYYDYNYVKICMQITRTRKNSQMWNQLVEIGIWMIVFPFSELFSMLYSFYNHKSPEKKWHEEDPVGQRMKKLCWARSWGKASLARGQPNSRRRRKQKESRHEDRRGRAVFGKLRRIQIKIYLEEHGKMGPEGKVDLSY